MVNFGTVVSSPVGCVHVFMKYELVDEDGNVVASAEGPDMFVGTLTVKNPMLWWPIGMSERPAYLYTLKVWH